ncbi:MAG: DUF1256 domain-containing protein [Clostridiales bacterium]|nr:DUF1256 domain-containing protein [Clostridiales bacterium]
MDIYLDGETAKRDFSFNLASILDGKLPVIMCVGSDRVVSDMIGPLIAEILVNKYDVDAYVYGRLDNPIVASNLKSAYRYIRSSHPDKKVIVIDATLGNLADIGIVKLRRGGCIPAGGFGVNSSVMGDVSIMPVVSSVGIDTRAFISATKFNIVYQMAKDIAECVNNAIIISKELSRLAI